jgi:hypothetical protein
VAGSDEKWKGRYYVSEDVFCDITRAGVANPIASYIPFQLDKLSAMEATGYAGADPHFTYNAFTVMLPLNDPQLVLFRDHLIDRVVTDAVTHNPRQFLIIGDPEMHTTDGHWQFTITRMRGT